MSLLTVYEELQQKAENELNEVPNKVQQNLDYIKKWLIEQPHLNARTDNQSLVNFLRVSKYNTEKTKERIDLFYTCKTIIPKFFSNRDPLLPEIQEMLTRRTLTVLPSTIDPAGPRLILIRAARTNPERVSVKNFAKCLFMILDILCVEDPNSTIVGISLIVDLKGMSYRYVTQITPRFIKKMTTCLLKAYPVRFKAIYFINPPSFFEDVYKLIKRFLDEKIQQRIHFYNKLDDCYNEIPRLMLPKEYGGEQASCEEISDEWKLKVESYRDWFLNDEQYCSKEEKRSGKPKTSKSVFG